MKVCPLCNSEKADDFFSVGRNQCKECRNRYYKEYYSNPEAKERRKGQLKQYRSKPETKEKTKERKKQYNSIPEVKERKKEYMKQYRSKSETAENKEKRKKYKREKYKNDPFYKVKWLVSGSILRSLKANAGSKNGASCWKYINYTKEDLVNYLESLFEPWMTWDNHGVYDPKTHDVNPTWQIDHIIPHSNFSYDSMEHPDFAKCWALSNLRPLCAKKNIEDGNRREVA